MQLKKIIAVKIQSNLALNLKIKHSLASNYEINNLIIDSIICNKITNINKMDICNLFLKTKVLNKNLLNNSLALHKFLQIHSKLISQKKNINLFGIIFNIIKRSFDLILAGRRYLKFIFILGILIKKIQKTNFIKIYKTLDLNFKPKKKFNDISTDEDMSVLWDRMLSYLKRIMKLLVWRFYYDINGKLIWILDYLDAEHPYLDVERSLKWLRLLLGLLLSEFLDVILYLISYLNCLFIFEFNFLSKFSKIEFNNLYNTIKNMKNNRIKRFTSILREFISIIYSILNDAICNFMSIIFYIPFILYNSIIVGLDIINYIKNISIRMINKYMNIIFYIADCIYYILKKILYITKTSIFIAKASLKVLKVLIYVLYQFFKLYLIYYTITNYRWVPIKTINKKFIHALYIDILKQLFNLLIKANVGLQNLSKLGYYRLKDLIVKNNCFLIYIKKQINRVLFKFFKRSILKVYEPITVYVHEELSNATCKNRFRAEKFLPKIITIPLIPVLSIIKKITRYRFIPQSFVESIKDPLLTSLLEGPQLSAVIGVIIILVKGLY